MSPLARAWLRRIALGLPLVVAPAAVPVGVTLLGCSCPDHTQVAAIDARQAGRILDTNGLATVSGCQSVCSEIFTSPPDTGPAPDAGALPHEDGSAIGCRVIGVASALEVRCEYHTFCPGGRRPMGLMALATHASTAGAWLARMAWMEAASVDAFLELSRDLARFDAPAALVRAARAAADDERRHARTMAKLARARGAELQAPRRTDHVPSTLESLAHDNAVEGGVREAFGAMLASIQAVHAPDRDLRDSMRVIARDEARHAMLSAHIDDWARTRTDGAALDRARAAAARELEASLVAEHDPVVAAALGLGSLETRVAIARALA